MPEAFHARFPVSVKVKSHARKTLSISSGLQPWRAASRQLEGLGRPRIAPLMLTANFKIDWH